MPSRFCIHYVSKSGRPSSGHRIGKSQSSSQFSRIVQTKECSNHQTIALISQASKVMLKILHSRLQHYVNQEPPDVQAGFRKGSRTKYQVANICWIIEKVREFQKKTSIFVSSTTLKPLTVWIMTNCGKILKMGIPDYLTCLLRNPMRVKNQQLEHCMKQLIGSRSRKEHDRAVCCHPVCLTCILSISGEMLGWMIYKLKSR